MEPSVLSIPVQDIIKEICPPMKLTQTSSYTRVSLRPHKGLIFNVTLKLPLPSTPGLPQSTAAHTMRPASLRAEPYLQTSQSQKKISIVSIVRSRSNRKREIQNIQKLQRLWPYRRYKSALVSWVFLVTQLLFIPLFTTKRMIT
jgi:hypothetical protein